MNPRKGLLWAVQCLLVCCLCIFSGSTAEAQLNFAMTASSSTYSYNPTSDTIISNSNDALITNVNIGFSFQYGCTTYTSFSASTDGYISLGFNTLSDITSNDLTTVSNGPIIAPLWDQLAFYSSNSSRSNLNYHLSGTAPNRILTIEWYKMKWNNGASGAVISFQLKLHETTNVIDFIYTQEGSSSTGSASIGLSGGIRSGDYYSLSSTGTSPTAQYGTQTSNLSALPANGQMYTWTPQNMTFVSALVSHVTKDSICVSNNINQPVFCLRVVTKGCVSPMAVTLINFNISTSVVSDIDSIHIYYTGNSAGFAASNPLSGKGVAPASGTISVTGTQYLLSDTNYFWIAYDIDPKATNKDVANAQISQVTVGGSARSLTSYNPDPGTARTIVTSCKPSPGGISGPSFWIKANAGTSTTTDGGSLSTWSDQSGNARNATQSTSSNRPAYKNNSTDNINFNPIINFTASSSNYMPILSNGVMSAGNNPYEVYVMLKPSSANLSSPGKFLFAGSGINGFNAFDARSGNAYLDSWDVNDLAISNMWTTAYPSMATFDFNSVQRQMWVSGGSAGTKVGNNRWSADAYDALGTQYSASPMIEFYDGGIAEIITYANKAQGQRTRNKVESYLALKYGVTMTHEYVDSHEDTVWRLEKNTAYNNNIIGLALDINGALSQKQAISTAVTSDILTMYMGTTKQVDQSTNTTSFPGTDTSFFIVGSNALTLNFSPMTTDVPSGVCCRLQRVWLAQKKNYASGTITMTFDLTNLSSGNTPLFQPDLRLLVDNDGVFSNATVLQPTISVSGEVVTVSVDASAITAAQPYFTLGSVANRTPLALQIQSFAAACQNKTVQTSWTIAQTNDACDFVVERSNNGGVFSPVGQVQGNPWGTLSYSWTDVNPLPGTSSYRLKATDYTTGAVVYSTIAAVSNCSSDNTVVIGSDPATGKSVWLSLQLQQNAMVDIGFYDLLGQRIELPGLTGRKNLGQGVTTLAIPQTNLATGIYLLTITVNDERQVYRIKE